MQPTSPEIQPSIDINPYMDRLLKPQSGRESLDSVISTFSQHDPALVITKILEALPENKQPSLVFADSTSPEVSSRIKHLNNAIFLSSRKPDLNSSPNNSIVWRQNLDTEISEYLENEGSLLEFLETIDKLYLKDFQSLN